MLQRLGFDRQESRVLVWGGVTLFLTGWADVSLKNVSEAYFLDEVGPHRLPWVFLASSVLLVASTWWVGHLTARQERLRILPRVLVGLGVSMLPFWALITVGDQPGDDPSRPLKSVFSLLVIASKQVQSLALLVFWAAMNDLVNARQAKRVFAPLMSGFTLGSITGSFASDNLAAWLGVASLVPISVVALVAAAACTLPLRRGRPARLRRRSSSPAAPVEPVPVPAPAGPAPRTEDEEHPPASVRTLWRESRLFRLLLFTGLFSGMLGPMLYFEFQWVAAQATEGSEQVKELIALYAAFRGWVNLGVLVAQLAATSSLYRWLGIPLSVALSPVVYLLGFGGLTLRLALPVGIGAMAATKLQDNAVYEPAMRVFFNLFPDRLRSRAGSFLDGPVKRGAGALGNVIIIVALAAASHQWVGYAGMGLAALWIGVSWILWREYPRLLLAATAVRRGRDLEIAMLDPATVRVLSRHLLDPDPERCAAAISLVDEARPKLAIPALVPALRRAPPATRSLLLRALERVLDRTVTEPVRDARAAREIEAMLEEAPDLPDLDRSRLVQAYGRLVPDGDGAALLQRAQEDAAPAVRLAAAAALGSGDLDARLASAAASSDPGERAMARRELRASLLCDPEDPAWAPRLRLLAGMLDQDAERRPAAVALADVALRHGERVSPVAERVLAFRDDPLRDVRAAVLRFAGHAGREDQAGWLVEQLAERDRVVAEAAREGLAALGPRVTAVCLKEAPHGRRSKRDASLPVLRELRPDRQELWELYERELAAIRRIIVQHHALGAQPGFDLVAQRLDERIDEGMHTALLLLATLRDRDEFEALAESLPGTPSGRRRATLVEALEEIMGARERSDLLPLLDDDPERRCRRAAAALGVELPSFEELIQQLGKSSDELTRTLVAGSLRLLGEPDLAGPGDLEDHRGVLSPTEIVLQLKSLPMFEGLTTRQLMDLSQVVSEVTHPPDVTVVQEGGRDECMYLIVEGSVEVRKNGRRVALLGPNEFFGEMSVLERAPRTADVVTRERTRLLCLQRTELFRLMEEFPTIPIIMCQTLSRRVRELLEGRT